MVGPGGKLKSLCVATADSARIPRDRGRVEHDEAKQAREGREEGKVAANAPRTRPNTVVFIDLRFIPVSRNTPVLKVHPIASNCM